MSIKKDKYYIKLANNLAYNFNGYSGPNPSVGAVVVKNNKIISFGNTGFSGRPHAEVNALKNLSKNNKKNSTIYISLEPCAHYGKTPPCVDKIIKSNINRVVYSSNDIDERTSGKAYKILKSKNIEVKKNLLKNNSSKIYKSYFYSKKKQMPYIYGKLAISKDYYIKHKKKIFITNEHSRKSTHVLRSKVNCIITTYKTVNDDNPKLNCRLNGLSKSSPKVAILDKNLKIKKNSFLISNAKKNKTYLFYNKKKKKVFDYLKSKKVKMIYAPLHNRELDFKFILKSLYKHEISTALIEGGKALTYSLLNNGFFNEFYLFISPKYLKNKGLLKVPNIKSNLSMRFKNIKLNETFLDKDNLIHYY
tara:strand:+ start:1460 stop:2545 length:1086 start_codon:yes stop_codon:yes gene_type:complete